MYKNLILFSFDANKYELTARIIAAVMSYFQKAITDSGAAGKMLLSCW